MSETTACLKPCSAREFVETNGRKGSMEQFHAALRAQRWGLKADVWASIVPDSMIASEFAEIAAQLAFIGFPDLRA